MGGGSDLQRLSGGENCVLGPRRGVPRTQRRITRQRRHGHGRALEVLQLPLSGVEEHAPAGY